MQNRTHASMAAAAGAAAESDLGGTVRQVGMCCVLCVVCCVLGVVSCEECVVYKSRMCKSRMCCVLLCVLWRMCCVEE